MNGKRPLLESEYNRIHEYLIENDRFRDLAMVSICYHTGYRIKEVLSIRVKDIITADGDFKASLYVNPKDMKRKKARMPIPMRDDLKEDLQLLLDELKATDNLGQKNYLIQSQKGGNKSISYTQAYRITRDLFEDCEIYDNVAVHSFRKSFCERSYQHTKNIVQTQRIMGHSTPVTTLKYLRVDQQELNDAILNM